MIRFRTLIALAFIVIAVVPVLMLGGWVANSAFDKELDGVRQKHAVVARNLTAALSVCLDNLRTEARGGGAPQKRSRVAQDSSPVARRHRKPAGWV